MYQKGHKIKFWCGLQILEENFLPTKWPKDRFSSMSLVFVGVRFFHKWTIFMLKIGQKQHLKYKHVLKTKF